MRALLRTSAILACVASAMALGACQVAEDGDDLVAGKEAFIAKCGACHTLERAGTTGVSGPNLDHAFSKALSEGIGRDTVAAVVRQQIAYPNQTAQIDPATRKPIPPMPADLVNGELAEDVAAYVASAAGRSGEDPGRLADIGVKKAEGTAKAENGEIDIDADPSGALAYVFASAEAEAGELIMRSKNDSSVPHNIALEGGGINEIGEVVQGGGVSEITVTVKAGEYTFYCSVPGHREGGMEGKLTVE